MPQQVTSRDADLLAHFGFKWARGELIETVYYDHIQSTAAVNGRLLINYTNKHRLASSMAIVELVDIPKGLMAGGGPKNLETSWIFVYYKTIEDTAHDGRKTFR